MADGHFDFLGLSAPAGEPLFPPANGLPLLFAYHLEYMDYLLDLALAGRLDVVDRLVRLRLLAKPSRHPAALHPYPASRRCAAFVRLLPFVEGGLRDLVARGAFALAGRIRRNLEFDVGGNHLLENGLALVLAGAAFRGREAAEFRTMGARLLGSGARDQVLADGGHYELSPAYHARVLEVLVEGGLALRRVGYRLDSGYWPVLAGMTEWLESVLDPEGALPLFGDCWRSDAFRPRRFLAAVRDLLPGVAPESETRDRVGAGSGLVFLGDPEQGHRLLLDAGPTCPPRLPAHGHADTFSYELHLSGRPVVVDAGLFEYAAGDMRDYCRSTRSHSTVEVDGEDSSEVWSSFRIGRRARVRGLAFLARRGLGTVTAVHDGYRHIHVEHARRVRHLKNGAFLLIDRVRGRRSHTVISRIHLHPESVLERRPGGGHFIHCRGVTASLVVAGATRVSIESGWHCPDFGRRLRTRVLALHAQGRETVTAYVLSEGIHPDATLRCDDAVVRGRLGDLDFSEPIP